MDEVLEGLLKLILPIIGFFIVVYIILLVLAVTSVLAMTALGIISVYIVKSARALVVEERAGKALVLSAGWASILTVGCIIGSFGLLISLRFALGDAFTQTMQVDIGTPESFWGLWIALDGWLMNSAYLFFVKTAILLYLANRVYLARSHGGNAWLGVVPPVIGMVVFFVGDHWELVMRTLTLMDHADLNTLAREILNVIYLPIELGMMAVTNPDSALAWAKEQIVTSQGSMFKLVAFFPTIFWVISIAFAFKALAASAATA